MWFKNDYLTSMYCSIEMYSITHRIMWTNESNIRMRIGVHYISINTICSFLYTKEIFCELFSHSIVFFLAIAQTNSNFLRNFNVCSRKRCLIIFDDEYINQKYCLLINSCYCCVIFSLLIRIESKNLRGNHWLIQIECMTSLTVSFVLNK